MIKKATEYILSRLFPPVCPFCECVVEGTKSAVCEDCLQQLPFIEAPRCAKCGKALKSVEDGICADCREGVHLFSEGRALWKDEGNVAASILRFKYHDQKNYAPVYAEWMVRCLGDWIRSLQIDLMVPVPVHKKRLKERSYNQAQLLAEEMGRRMDIPVYADLLYRWKNTAPQKNLSAFARMRNLQDAFAVRGDALKNRRVLVIDDIYTTGVTIDAASCALRAHGAQAVYFAALASGGM